MNALLERLAQEVGRAVPKATVLEGEPLSTHTSFGVGGPADLLIIAHSAGELATVVTVARRHEVPCLVLGSGTNVLVADEGIRGLVVLNAGREYALQADGLLVAASGTPLCELARWSVAEGWRGLQWAVGIPGTLGGALVGNAGAYGGCMADIVEWVRLLRPDGAVVQVAAAEMDYGYRTSALKREHLRGQRTLVLQAGLRLAADDAEALAVEAAGYTQRRESSTPRGACAGSMFKRTAHYPAGYLIEKAGLKGLRIGGAQVSPKHANFLMNTGSATARDVRQLIETVQAEVWRRYAQHLDPEVEFVGDWHWPVAEVQ